MRKKLTQNFYRDEFACQGENCCGGSSPMDRGFVRKLQKLRDHLGVSITVSSGFRCNVHNKAIGGAENSQHCLGIAADIKSSKPVSEMLEAAQQLFGGNRCLF